MIVEITPIALTNIKYKFYVILAVFNACIAVIVFFLWPETNKMSLEEIDFYFADKHGGNEAKGVEDEGEGTRKDANTRHVELAEV